MRFAKQARALLALFALLSSAACKSECLRDDCLSAAPTEVPSEAGGAGANSAGATGVAGKGNAGANGAAGNGSPTGKACTANETCQTAQGEACVDGTCRVPCASHFDCQGFGVCKTSTDGAGNSGHFCELGKTQPAGQFFTHCPSGTDAECDSANGFFCVSAGAGDLDAYCTTDCTNDSTCADGYACTPLTRSPCVDTCGLKGDAKDRSCIPLAQIGPGKAYQCGKHGVVRSACRPRKFCSTCEVDSDCLAVGNQVCAKDQSGAKICTELCDLKHPSCPWGNAATCGAWDSSLGGVATCSHRFGECTGTGKPCEPCLKDSDCGSNGVCYASQFTGERWCVDLNQSCDCGANNTTGLCTGGGCGNSPGGLAMLCSDSTTDTPNDGVCFGANTSTGIIAASSQQTGCWPAR
ncbi:MAG: hypothetical protein ABUL62_22835 [Myxococcales bacterium]